jgi:hypothetical protein
MKWILRFFAISLMLLSIQCSENKDQTKSRANTILKELEQKKQSIITYINTFDCTVAVGCSSIPFGSKACGGPKEHLLFSNNVNLATLQEMVQEYNKLETEYNVLADVVSDCMFVVPPTSVSCVNGVCTAIN